MARSFPVAVNPLTLSEIGDPAALVDTGRVFSKDIAGITELHYREDSAAGGTIIQITSNGTLNIPGGGGVGGSGTLNRLSQWTAANAIGNAAALATGQVLVGVTGAAPVAGDHGNIGGLLDDDHTIYPLLAGRAGTANDWTIRTTEGRATIIAVNATTVAGGSGFDFVANRDTVNSGHGTFKWFTRNSPVTLVGTLDVSTGLILGPTTSATFGLHVGEAEPNVSIGTKVDFNGDLRWRLNNLDPLANAVSILEIVTNTGGGKGLFLYRFGVGHPTRPDEVIIQSTAGAKFTLSTFTATPVVIDTNNVERLRVLSTGEILVNATSLISTERLRVNGDILADGNLLFRSGTGFTGAFDHAITATRTWIFPDAGGTVALLSLAQTWTATQTISELAVTGNTGLFGVAPVARSVGWSVANALTDKIFDANATSIDELADVLGTLINYLITLGPLGP